MVMKKKKCLQEEKKKLNQELAGFNEKTELSIIILYTRL
jgi:hypothetical protein